MAALSDEYQVVAISLRGYNRSDRPAGVENYDIEHLTADVAATQRVEKLELPTTTGADADRIGVSSEGPGELQSRHDRGRAGNACD